MVGFVHEYNFSHAWYNSFGLKIQFLNFCHNPSFDVMTKSRTNMELSQNKMKVLVQVNRIYNGISIKVPYCQRGHWPFFQMEDNVSILSWMCNQLLKWKTNYPSYNLKNQKFFLRIKWWKGLKCGMKARNCYAWSGNVWESKWSISKLPYWTFTLRVRSPKFLNQSLKDQINLSKLGHV